MPTRPRLSVAIVTAVLCSRVPHAYPAQLQFLDETQARGITNPVTMDGMAAGAAAADYDDDGDIDLFVPTEHGHADRLYRNLGDGTYQDIAEQVGLDSLDAHRAALWLDYDGDRAMDLVVFGGDCWSECPPENAPLKLYRQENDGTFTAVNPLLDPGGRPIGKPEGDGIAPLHASSIAAGDINRDGFLDLYVSVWRGYCRLFLNNGDGTLADISSWSGACDRYEHVWQTMFHDFDGDGWQDIYVCVDAEPNHLYRNQRNNTFVDVAPQYGLDNSMNDMGLTLGDYDNDGDFDLYITNIWNIHGRGEHNVMFRDDSFGDQPWFTEVAAELGVDQGHWGWGATFADANNDGWLDLAATNGFFDEPWDSDPSRFFLHNGQTPVAYQDVSTAVGFHDTDWGSCLVSFDSNRDGDLDLLQVCNGAGPLRLLENQLDATAPDQHWLVVRPRIRGANHWAIGTVIRVKSAALEMARLISAGTSLLGQEPAEAFFGLAHHPRAARITIEWPDGTSTVLRDVDANQVLTVHHDPVLPPPPLYGDVNGDGRIDIGDIFALIEVWGDCEYGDPCPADLNGNGSVGWIDLTILIGLWLF